MALTQREMQELLERVAQLQRDLVDRLADQLPERREQAEQISSRLDRMLERLERANGGPPPPDSGLGALIGLGPGGASALGDTRMPHGVDAYDEQVNTERICAIGDLYYIYQHERIGVFRAIQKLKELFHAGTVRLSAGPGAYALYQFDRKEVLRYTSRDRHAAYRRAFGYGASVVPAGARPNSEFHGLFTFFVNQVTQFWRDKRISDVVRDRAHDPSFGSIAMVRRAGLDLRNNLKHTSYGHLNVLRVEVMQLLDETFRVLGSQDVRSLFGADNAWDVIEEILTRYFRESLTTSPRQRMAVSGRNVLRWLAQRDIQEPGRTQFEALLTSIAEDAEEWLTSAQALGLARRTGERGRTRGSRSEPAAPAPLARVGPGVPA